VLTAHGLKSDLKADTRVTTSPGYQGQESDSIETLKIHRQTLKQIDCMASNDSKKTIQLVQKCFCTVVDWAECFKGKWLEGEFLLQVRVKVDLPTASSAKSPAVIEVIGIYDSTSVRASVTSQVIGQHVSHIISAIQSVRSDGLLRDWNTDADVTQNLVAHHSTERNLVRETVRTIGSNQQAVGTEVEYKGWYQGGDPRTFECSRRLV
jgi:hypothetical protein